MKHIDPLQETNTLTTDEAGSLQNFFFFLFFASQVSKGVDDDTKNEVEDDDDDHEEEQQVINHSGCKEWLLSGKKEIGMESVNHLIPENIGVS